MTLEADQSLLTRIVRLEQKLEAKDDERKELRLSIAGLRQVT